MTLSAQIYIKFNFRPNILRFHKRKQMVEGEAGLPWERRGDRKGQCHKLEQLPHYMAPDTVGAGTGPSEFQIQLLRDLFFFGNNFCSF